MRRGWVRFAQKWPVEMSFRGTLFTLNAVHISEAVLYSFYMSKDVESVLLLSFSTSFTQVYELLLE